MLVSVLLPVHNGSAYITKAIESIQRQSFTEFELVIVDDGSTDATPEIVKEIATKDPRIRYLRKNRGGIVGALNHGLEACTGKYIARMDADDISLPERLKLQLAFMETHMEVAACGMAIRKFRGHLPIFWMTERFPQTDRGVATRLLFNPPLMHPTTMIQSCILRDVGGYDPEYESAEDYELWSRISALHRITNLPQVGLYYRRSGGSISENRAQHQHRIASKVRYHNLVKLFGPSEAERCWHLHQEINARHFTHPEQVRELAGYMRSLLADNRLDPSVLSNVWFGYCIRRANIGLPVYKTYKLTDGQGSIPRKLLLATLCMLRKGYA
jgi:glycosyltransferase involved in cell wall biosynthesis